MERAADASHEVAGPLALPSEEHSVCRRLWDDEILLVSTPFRMAVMPFITLVICALFLIFLLAALRYVMEFRSGDFEIVGITSKCWRFSCRPDFFSFHLSPSS